MKSSGHSSLIWEPKHYWEYWNPSCKKLSEWCYLIEEFSSTNILKFTGPAPSGFKSCLFNITFDINISFLFQVTSFLKSLIYRTLKQLLSSLLNRWFKWFPRDMSTRNLRNYESLLHLTQQVSDDQLWVFQSWRIFIQLGQKINWQCWTLSNHHAFGKKQQFKKSLKSLFSNIYKTLHAPSFFEPTLIHHNSLNEITSLSGVYWLWWCHSTS